RAPLRCIANGCRKQVVFLAVLSTHLVRACRGRRPRGAGGGRTGALGPVRFFFAATDPFRVAQADLRRTAQALEAARVPSSARRRSETTHRGGDDEHAPGNSRSRKRRRPP